MKLSIFPLFLLALSAAHPVSKPAVQLDNSQSCEDVVVEKLNNELYNAAYKQNFKEILTQYVLSEYKGLTINEKKKVKNIIEDLLENVAQDFRIILNSHGVLTEDIITRIGHPTFDVIHEFIVSGIPDIDEHNALRLTYRLENNLLHAKQRIEKVIKDSKLAQIQYS